MTTKIRRWVETDTGHRVPNHKSKCKNMHGHRYRWEVELEGEVVAHPGTSEEGMLMDFSDISMILQKYTPCKVLIQRFWQPLSVMENIS